jgi:hypothetical protein
MEMQIFEEEQHRESLPQILGANLRDLQRIMMLE